jgi:hypothetical protein
MCQSTDLLLIPRHRGRAPDRGKVVVSAIKKPAQEHGQEQDLLYFVRVLYPGVFVPSQ